MGCVTVSGNSLSTPHTVTSGGVYRKELICCELGPRRILLEHSKRAQWLWIGELWNEWIQHEQLRTNTTADSFTADSGK